MTSLRDPFSAVRKAQFEAQFDFFNTLTTQAFENASRLAALNLSASRDSVERSLGATFALMNSRDPRDLLSLGGQAEAQVHSLFAYGRELLGIAGGARPYAVRPQALSLSPQGAIETVEVIEHAAAEAVPQAASAAADAVASLADAAAAEAAPAEVFAASEAPAAPTASEAVAAAVEAAAPVADVAPAAEPVVVAEAQAAADVSDTAQLAAVEPAPVAEPKAIAKAAGKGTARAAVAPHPAAAPVAALDAAEVAKVDVPPVSTKRKK